MAQWVLLIIKNDIPELRGDALSWWVVFIPVWIAAAWFPLRAVMWWGRVRAKKAKKERDARARTSHDGFVPGMEGEPVHKSATEEDDVEV
jgi:hypothetical protein